MTIRGMPHDPERDSQGLCRHSLRATENGRVQHRTTRREPSVDVLLAQAEQAGATLTGRPHDRPWEVYSGYFRDPDGHLWEIIWNPPTENTT